MTTAEKLAVCDRREAAGLLPRPWRMLRQSVRVDGLLKFAPMDDTTARDARGLEGAGLVTVTKVRHTGWLVIKPTDDGQRVAAEIDPALRP